MFNIYNPFQMMPTPPEDPMKDMTEEERIKVCFLHLLSFFGTMIIALVIIGIISLLTGCATPKIVEQHHHHYEQADTLAIQARIDRSMNSWHAQMDSSWHQRLDEYSASWFSHDDQKEHITETITTYIDSLGREVRQEQRTTDRSLSRMQQQTEQRLTREFEVRLSTAIDSVNSIWQSKLDAIQAHWEKTDSTDIKETPVTNSELPWYKLWWQTLKDYLLNAGIVLLIIVTRRIWWPWCKKLFRI